MRAAVVATVVTLLATSALSSVARADTIINPSDPPGLKSNDTALALSIIVTTGSWGLVAMGKDNPVPGVIGAMGAYFGPSLAQLYASDRPHARGFMLRTVGIVGLAAGAHAGVACSSGCEAEWISASFYVAGALAITAGTVDDIVRQPALVRRYNRRVRELAMVPVVSQDTAAVTISGRF